MRPTQSFCIGLLAVSATTLLPAVLHAQAIGRMGRPSGPSAPAPSAPAPRQSAPIYNAPSYPQPTSRPSYSAPSYSQPAPRQMMPMRSGPIFAPPQPGAGAASNQPQPGGYPLYSQPVRQSGRSYGPQFSGRGRGDAAPSSQAQNGRIAGPTGRAYAGPGYQIYGNGPSFGGQSSYNRHRSVRVTTPVGPSTLPNGNPYPIYGGFPTNNYGGGYGSGVTVIGQPTFLGGFYYGGYCDTPFGVNTYPSVYSTYSGFPNYIYSPASVIVLSDPYSPVYVTGYQPFYTPSYPVVYNENIYYVGSQERAQQITGDDETARKAALRNAYPEGSYQAAFGDIERAWLDGNVNALQKHLRGGDVKLSVFFKGKYSYSIATSDYVQITRDAFDKISTVSFKFDRLRKAKNGDVTAYGTHVYRGSASGDSAGTDSTVPFSTDGGDVTSDNTSRAAPGVEKTANVAYTLRHQDGQWNIVAIDSSPAGGAK